MKKYKFKAANRTFQLLEQGTVPCSIFQGEPRKIRIISNSTGYYGLCPEPEEEVEQHLTINADGLVWFSAYNFGDGFDHHKKARSQMYKIDKTSATNMLTSIARYFSDEYDEWFATDIGDWVMEITNTEGNVYKFRGSLCAHFIVDGIDLSDLVRETLGMDDLYVFDGNSI